MVRLVLTCTIAVVGPMANLSTVMMGSKQDYSGENVVTLLAGIAAQMGGTPVSFAAGVRVNGDEAPGGGTPAVGVNPRNAVRTYRF